MNVTTIGLDIAKNVFQLHGVDANGKTILRKKMKKACKNEVSIYKAK